MANNDFFLDFGSNAGPWAKTLVRDLQPARQAVAGLMQDLQKLNQAGAQVAGNTATRLQGARAGAVPTPAAAATTNNPSEIAAGVADMVRHLASYDAEMTQMMSRLGSIVDRIGKVGDTLANERKRQAYSRGQQERQAGAGASLRDPNTGAFVPAGTAGAIVHPRTGAPIAGGQQQVTIAGTPRVLIEEAAFARVVQAVERNVDATRAVENAINRLNARGGIPAARPNGQAADPRVGAPQGATDANSRAAQLQQLQAEFRALQAEREGLVEQDQKITAAERRVANREAAAAERAARLPAQVRADRQRDIELAGSEETLRSLPKRDLRRVADTFTQEGYNTPSNTKTTREQFVQAIQASRQQYDASGGITKNDLSVSSKVVATEVSKAVRPMVEAIIRAAKMIEGEPEAYATRRLDRLTGGQDTRLRGDDGKERIQRGLVQRGAAFGGDLNEVIDKAEQTIAARNERVSQAALQQALKLTQRPGFDPYSPELRAGIRGRGDEAIEARSGLGKLTRATEAVDKVGAEVIELDRRLNQAETALAKMTQAADLFASRQKLSADEVARYTSLLAKIPQQEARVEAQRARLRDIQGHEAFLTPEFRQGLTARQSSQAAYTDARQQQAERRSLEKATSPIQAAMEALFGGATNIGSAAGNKATFARLFPGVGPSGRGATRGLRFTDADRDPRELEPLESAFKKYGSALRELEATSQAGGSPEELVELDRKMRQRLEQIINAYERVMGTKLPTDVEKGFRTYSRGQQYQAANNPRTDPSAVAEARANARAAAGAGGSGSGGGRGRTAAGAADGPGGGRDSEIVAVLKAIHATIKAGIKITPTRPGTSRRRNGQLTPEELASFPPPDPAQRIVRESAGAEARANTRARREPPLYSTAGGRGAFVQNLDAEMQALVRGEDKVAAATALVNKRILTQTEALGFFRSELKQTAGEAAAFENAVRASIGDTRLNARGEAEARRRQREAQLAAAGDPKAQAAARQQLRTESLLADTLGRLSVRAREHIETLRQMTAAGADSAEIAQQQVRVYHRLAEELGSQGFNTPQVRQRASGVFGATGTRLSGSEIGGIAQIAKATAPALEAQGEEMGASLRTGVSRLFGDHGFWNRVVASTGTFIVRNFSAGFVFGITNVLQEAVAQAIETESTFVRVSAALEATGRSTTGLRTQLQSISTDYGVALQDVYETTASLVGLFETPHDLAGAARIVSQLSSISRGALNAAEATATLASITSSFGDLRNVEGLKHIADVLTVIQERVGVNIETTAEGIARMSGLAQQVGLTFEQTAVLVGEIAKKTGQTGAAAGEQFSRIVATLQTGRGREALIQNLPGDSGIQGALNNREYGQAIEILMKNYEGLTKAQQDNIAVTLGGQRQAAAISALLSEGSKTLDTITAAQDAKNQADTRSAQIANTLQGQLQKLKSNIVNLVEALSRTGLIDFFGLLLQVTNNLLGATNGLLSSFNDFADSNPMLEFLKHAVFGVTGLIIALVVLRKAISGLRASFAGGGFDFGDDFGDGGIDGGSGRAPSATEEERRQRREEQRRQREEDRAQRRRERGRVGGAYLGASEAFGRRGVSLDEFASNRRALADQAETDRPVRRQSILRTNVGDLVGQGATSPRILRAQAAAASTASKAVSGLSSGMNAMSQHAGTATAAIAAVGLAIGFIIADMQRRAEFAKRQQAAYDARFGVNQGKTAEQIQREGYVGPSSELLKEQRQRQAGAGGALNTLGSGIAGTVPRSVSNRFSSKIGIIGAPLDISESALKFATGIGDQIGKDLGEIPDDVQKQLDDTLKKSFQELAAGKGSTNPYENALYTKEQRVNELLKAQESSQNTLKLAAQKVKENENLSAEQKNAALAQLEEIQKANRKVAEDLLLQTQGLGDANALTQEQVQKVDELVQSTANLTSGTAEQFATALQQMTKDLGLGEGNNVKPEIDKLTRGGLTQIDSLRAQAAIIQTEADSLAAEYVVFANGKGDQEQVDEARQAALQKIAQLDQITQQILAAEVQSANDFSTFYRTRGNYSESVAGLNGAVAALRAEANKPGQAADRRIQLLNQADQLAQQATQDRIAGATQEAQLAKSRTRNSVTDAALELQIAKTTLNETNKAFQTGGATREQQVAAEQQYNQALQSYADTGQAQTQARFSSKAAQTLNTVARAQIENVAALQALAFAQQQYGYGTEQYNQALAQVASTQQAMAQAVQGQTQSTFQVQAAKTNDPRAKAGIDVSANLQSLTFNEQQYGKDSEQYNQALANLWNARQAYVQQEQSYSQSRFTVRAARTLNAVAKAQIEESGALQALAFARSNYGEGTEQYNSALAAVYQAQFAREAAALEERQAARETAVTRIAPGNAVAIARKRLSNAQKAQQEARRFGTSSTQYQQATQQVIEAMRATEDAVQDVFKANANLGVALAEAAGRTVDAARIRLVEARREVQRARKKSGGVETADVINARASAVSAEAAYRDAQLQDKLDTVDFNKEMGKITAQGAIAALQAILRTTNLTKQQRRDLLLKIKGMQDDLRQNLTGSGFNIPDEIKLPTAYEVRRSLGIDKYLKAAQARVSDSIKAAPVSRVAGGNGALTAASAAPSAAVSSSGVIAAVNQVAAAVQANGAQVTNDIKVTNQVAQPAMIELVARRVVELISTSTTAAARANQASPKLVSY